MRCPFQTAFCQDSLLIIAADAYLQFLMLWFWPDEVLHCRPIVSNHHIMGFKQTYGALTLLAPGHLLAGAV